MTIPRRNRLDLAIRPELAIRAAMAAVEEMHADRRLTEAVILCQQALGLVADVVDDDLASPEPSYMTPAILSERSKAERRTRCSADSGSACEGHGCPVHGGERVNGYEK
jgi:hypothetical protein